MSTDWNVHCVDCNVTTHFNDANHQDQLMLLLCRNADAIAALAELAATLDVRLTTYWGDIDIAWFRQHMGHQLMPISEYGDLLDSCGEWVTCICGTQRRCSLKFDHDGEHRHEERRR